MGSQSGQFVWFRQTRIGIPYGLVWKQKSKNCSFSTYTSICQMTHPPLNPLLTLVSNSKKSKEAAVSHYAFTSKALVNSSAQ